VGSAARRRRWTGPPPLLVLATVLAFMVAPVFSRSDSVSATEGESAVRASLASGYSREAPVPVVGEAPPTLAGRTIERRDVVGLVSMNQFSTLSLPQARSDADRVTSRPAVDVVGWQEAQHFGGVFWSLRQRGWDTRRFPQGARELAVSWRRSEFAYVSSSSRLVAWGVDHRTGRYPFGNRYIVRVTLRHRPTGRLLSVINTHLPHKAEDRDHPGRWTPTSNAARARFQLERMRKEWEQAPGRWVVGTGDYNFDAVADARVRLPKAPLRALSPVALSSYAVLGVRGLQPTHPPTGRFIDYVHAARRDLRTGTVRFLGQRILAGLNSDHNALLVRLVLR
jgi:endonuclease/exonuclease/phosphatase family metal-dependent hydrolase